MNLRIADSAGLVAFLHRVIGESGHKVVATPEVDVVQVGDVFFFHRKEPVTVGGPFSSVGALVRSEGVPTSGPRAYRAERPHGRGL